MDIVIKNENKTDEIVDTFTFLHHYIQMQSKTTVVSVPEMEDSDKIQVQSLHHILVGGHQLTSERIRGAQSLPTHAVGCLEGLIPMSEDWHAKMCFMEV